MAQQLNLYADRFKPQTLRFSARQGAALLVLALGSAVLLSQVLQWQTRSALAAAQAVEAGNDPLRKQLVASVRPSSDWSSDSEAELARLQVLEASQRRIRAALDAGLAGSREGHADYLVALARQASGQVWLTGFTVTEGGASLVLEGRMSDAAALTEYLRRLNAEPRFKGRPFAQLTLQAVTGPDGLPAFTEFTLKANAGNAVDPGVAAQAAADTLALAAAAATDTASAPGPLLAGTAGTLTAQSAQATPTAPGATR